MKRNAVFFAFAVCLFFVTSGLIFAQSPRGSNRSQVIEVRIASAMPQNSDWGRTLDRIAAEWVRVTNNQIVPRVIHGGVEGADARMLSSLSSNNIQAAVFSTFGLAEICPSIMNLSVPFLIRNDAELDLIMREVQSVFEDQISRTNFVVVAWSRGGWINVFSKDPVITPDDLRRQRIATSPDQVDLNTAFKTMGFNLVETGNTDIGTRVASGTISAVYQSPLAVVPLQLHKTLGNMLDIPLAPFIGGIVMNRVTWNKLTPEQQQEIKRVTQQIANQLDETMPRIASNAMAAMQRDGLRVNHGQEALWRDEVVKAVPSLLGTTFDRDMYQRINAILERIRSGQ